MFGSHVVARLSTVGTSRLSEPAHTSHRAVVVRRFTATCQVAIAKGFGKSHEKIVELAGESAVLHMIGLYGPCFLKSHLSMSILIWHSLTYL